MACWRPSSWVVRQHGVTNMANASELGQPQTQGVNGNTEVERLATLVQQLQDECAKLRQALAKTEAERHLYRQAFYANARATREFQDVDIPSLEAISAGPVEMMEY